MITAEEHLHAGHAMSATLPELSLSEAEIASGLEYFRRQSPTYHHALPCSELVKLGETALAAHAYKAALDNATETIEIQRFDAAVAVGRLRLAETIRDDFQRRWKEAEAALAAEHGAREEADALSARSLSRLAEMSEPGFIGAFAARDAWKERADEALVAKDRAEEERDEFKRLYEAGTKNWNPVYEVVLNERDTAKAEVARLTSALAGAREALLDAHDMYGNNDVAKHALDVIERALAHLATEPAKAEKEEQAETDHAQAKEAATQWRHPFCPLCNGTGLNVKGWGWGERQEMLRNETAALTSALHALSHPTTEPPKAEDSDVAQ